MWNTRALLDENHFLKGRIEELEGIASNLAKETRSRGQRIAELEAQSNDMRLLAKERGEKLAEHWKQIEKLESQLAELKPYIKHTRDCPQPTAGDIDLSSLGINTHCTCGLDAIIHREKGDG
jgi:uncharacterized coiled-coil protein SlyX